MTTGFNDVRFAVKALPAAGTRPNEMTHTMAPHPLVYQELPYDPEFLLYNHRLIAMRLSTVTPDEAYWRVRRQVILRHTGELPLEVRGPDAVRMLDHVFTRDANRVGVGRCSYQFACYDDGGMITDGVLMRLEPDRFWFGQADGDLVHAEFAGVARRYHCVAMGSIVLGEPDARMRETAEGGRAALEAPLELVVIDG